jgi:inhibitor of cysteine peptidase
MISSAIITLIIIGAAIISILYYQRSVNSNVDDSIIKGIADVEEIEIYILESFPVQVNVVARGYLRDSCTEIEEVITRREENTFLIKITTTRPYDKCAQVIKPFEEVISLDVFGLEAGAYDVEVNGIKDSFELTVDNIIPKEDVLSVSELLESPLYDTKIRVSGKVSLLGELFCPCFELTSGNKTIIVWYDLMVEDDSTERPSVDVSAIKNGDLVIVTGELKTEGKHRSLNDFWASDIKKIG